MVVVLGGSVVGWQCAASGILNVSEGWNAACQNGVGVHHHLYSKRPQGIFAMKAGREA
jgi:hypothetical protein